MEAKIRALERQIEKVKRELMTLGALQPGSLSGQYNVCGKAKCGCKETPPRKHGPYYQLSFTRKGKSTTRFVRRENLTAVKKQLRNYARLRKLVDRWIDLSTELCLLQLAKAKSSAEAGGGRSRK
jgi:hypothetical protein